jgi:hypothetical protein
MPENRETSGAVDPVLRPLLDFWAEAFEAGAGQAKPLWEGVAGVGDLAGLRKRWFEALSQSLDAYMRTPVFLEVMRRNFEVNTLLKGASEDVTQELARQTGVPRLPDISGLFERLRIGQEAILAKLSGIERRLKTLENREKAAAH